MVGRRALLRQPRARPTVRCRPDGPDLRESRGAERQTRSGRGRQGHPRNVRPHGDERRGNRRADRRRPHFRQSPRCCRRGQVRGSRTRRSQHRRARARLEEHLRHRRRGRCDHQRPRRRVDQQPREVGQRLLRQPLRLRLGIAQRSRRCLPVAAEGRQGQRHHPGRPRSIQKTRPDDVHDGPRPADGSDLRADLAAVPQEPGRVRRRLRQGLVQADASRHGARLAAARPARPAAAVVARPRARRRS